MIHRLQVDYSPIDLLCQCLQQINNWMSQHFLQLNKDKTEIIVFGNKKKRISVSLVNTSSLKL